MVLVQIYIGQAENNRYFDVPLYGIYDVNIIGLQFHDALGAGQTSVIQIQSDIIRFNSSSRPNLLFMNNATANVNYSAALEAMPSIKNADFNGKVFMNITGVSGTALGANWHLILTLEATCAHKPK